MDVFEGGYRWRGLPVYWECVREKIQRGGRIKGNLTDIMERKKHPVVKIGCFVMVVKE